MLTLEYKTEYSLIKVEGWGQESMVWVWQSGMPRFME